MSALLNPEFSQVGWRPDASATYKCSPRTDSKGFTYLMALVISGRNPARPHQLARQAELDTFLAAPDSGLECRRVNSMGWTALILAVCNSRVDSSEAVVAQLLAHESSSAVARVQNSFGWTALMIAARLSDTESTENTVTQLLAHESSSDVARMQRPDGWTALMLSTYISCGDNTKGTLAQLLAHESSSDVIHMKTNQGETALMMAAATSTTTSTDKIVKLLCTRVTQDALQSAFKAYPDTFFRCFCQMQQSLSERDTLSTALKEGISLPGATIKLYL
jgi:ankyrin repeat protein